MLGLHTFGDGFGSAARPSDSPHLGEYPTPTAGRYGSGGNGSGNNTASRGRPSLEAMARHDDWPDGRRWIPTPTAGDSASSGSRNTTSKAKPGVSLTDFVRGDGGTGRRPRAQGEWSTPQARDWKDTGSTQVARKDPNLGTEAHAATDGDTRGMLLNPDWEDRLMGWPIGWSSAEADVEEGVLEVAAWADGSWELLDGEQIPRVAPKVDETKARIKAIGNGQVPQCAVVAWWILSLPEK